jgi:hypothetical protein
MVQTAHACKLHNLRDDIGETNNLAAAQPALVKELDALIEKFLTDTKAVVPGPSPACDPNAKAPAGPKKKAGQKKDVSASTKSSVVASWSTSRVAKLVVNDGQLQMTSTGGDPWISTRDLPANAKGPFTLRLRMKSTASGAGPVYFSDSAKFGFSRERSVPLSVKHDGAWHDYEVKLPLEKLTALRLDPATAAGQIVVNGLELTDASGKSVKRR